MSIGEIIGFITLFLAGLKQSSDLGKQIGELNRGQADFLKQLENEKADRQRADDQTTTQLRECKTDHTNRLNRLEEKTT